MTKVSRKNILLIIDPQRDFHDGGSLPITGADADSSRIASMIMAEKDKIHAIFVTLDSHHRNHISHGAFWREKISNGNDSKKPSDFCTITHKEVLEGKFYPVDQNLTQYCKDYTRALEAANRFKHTIYPEHCLIGSVGHAVVADIHSALQEWCTHQHKNVSYVMKGQNCLTEMYSGIEAEVPVSSDPQTSTNTKLIGDLHEADRLIICGQALSHCVQYTVRDILKNWRNDKRAIFLLSDGSSPVRTEESLRSTEQFLLEMADTISICSVSEMFGLYADDF